MMRGPPAAYGTRGGYGARDPREYNQYYRHQGPSPWIPATILGVIVLITAMPYIKAPDATIAYQTAVRCSSRFSGAMLWIPVLGVIALQFFAGQWYYGYGDGVGYGRWGTRGEMYGGRLGYQSGAYGRVPGAYASRSGGLDRMTADYHRVRWGGWWPWSSSSSNPYIRYDIHHQRGLMSTFMEYGGHWLLILLGIAVFTLVSASSLPYTPAALPSPLAPHSWWCFPLSLFF